MDRARCFSVCTVQLRPTSTAPSLFLSPRRMLDARHYSSIACKEISKKKGSLGRPSHQKRADIAFRLPDMASSRPEISRPLHETIKIEGYSRSTAGLTLCLKCQALIYWPIPHPLPHYSSMQKLKSSALKKCWLCQTVYSLLLEIQSDLENPPVPPHSGFKPLSDSDRLLRWYLRRTRTLSGFLDDLRGKS